VTAIEAFRMARDVVVTGDQSPVLALSYEEEMTVRVALTGIVVPGRSREEVLLMLDKAIEGLESGK